MAPEPSHLNESNSFSTVSSSASPRLRVKLFPKGAKRQKDVTRRRGGAEKEEEDTEQIRKAGCLWTYWADFPSLRMLNAREMCLEPDLKIGNRAP